MDIETFKIADSILFKLNAINKEIRQLTGLSEYLKCEKPKHVSISTEYTDNADIRCSVHLIKAIELTIADLTDQKLLLLQQFKELV